MVPSCDITPHHTPPWPPIPPHVLPCSSRVPVQHLNVPCILQMQPDDWDEPPSPDLAPHPMPNLAPQQYGSSEEEEDDEDTRITVVSVYLNTVPPCHHPLLRLDTYLEHHAKGGTIHKIQVAQASSPCHKLSQRAYNNSR